MESSLKPTGATCSFPLWAMARRRGRAVTLALLASGVWTHVPSSARSAPAHTSQNAAPKNPALWTELQKKTNKKETLPSLAPLVERAQEAVVVVISHQQLHGLGKDLPEGHPSLPPGHPPVGGHASAQQADEPEGESLGHGGMAHQWRGQGSGFLIHPSGLVLTNYHVVEHTSDLRVRVGSQPTEVPAQIVGFDLKSDVALLRLDGGEDANWPSLPLGDSDALRVGDFVVSIGAPFGLARSVSMGIVSARGRHDVHPDGRAGLYDFLQTDAGLHAGNSGGPLLNLDGEVVGINTAVNAHAADIGFSIPINRVKRMLPTLYREGRVVRAWLGVGIQALTPELARAFGLAQPQGALVHEVVEDSPAAKNGIRPGDIVLRFGTKEILQAHELAWWAGESKVGEKVEIELWRNKRRLTQSLQLDAHPDNAEPPELSEHFPAVVAAQKGNDLGLRIVTLNQADRNELALPPDLAGARVVDVRLGSPAFLAGMRPDDVIIELEGDEVTSAETFAARVKTSDSGHMMRLRLWRSDKSLYVALEKP